MRPKLTNQIDIEDFVGYYWLKKELAEFCRSNNISYVGNKKDIFNRIKVFLETGEIVKTKSCSKKTSEIISLNSSLKHFRCDLRHRIFFQKIIGNHFKFNIVMIKFAKDNPDLKYKDIIDCWIKEIKKRKDKSYVSKISKSCEYNQFIRDFFSDKINQGKKITEAIDAWKCCKKRKGARKYLSE